MWVGDGDDWRGGMRGVIPFFGAFIWIFFWFIPSRGLCSRGLPGEKAAQAALLFLGSVLYTLP